MKNLFKCIALMTLIAGCDKDTENHVAPTKLDQMSDSDIIVTIGQRSYTVGEYRNDLQTRLELFERKAKNLTDEKKDELRQRMRDRILDRLCSTLALRLLAEQEGMPIPEEISKEVELRFSKFFCRSDEVLTDLKPVFSDPKYYECLMASIEAEKLTDAFVANRFGEQYKVTDSMLSDEFARIHREDLQADATNAVLYATATNVWKMAQAGDDFAKLADIYSQEKGREPGGDIGNCDNTDFAAEDNPEVWKSISQLKTGDVTPPMDTIEGLAIYKCIEHIKEDESTGNEAWHLARICFYRALKFPEYEQEELRKILIGNKKKACIAQCVNEFFSHTKVDFPNGVAFLPGRAKRAAMVIARMSNATINGKNFNQLRDEELASKNSTTNSVKNNNKVGKQ